MLLLTHQHIHDWSYLAEGNAHLILTYVGHDINLKGHVLRLVKNHGKDSYSSHFTIDFSQHVIGALLGSSYIDAMVTVEVTVEFMEALYEKVLPDRLSNNRLDPICTSPSSGFLLKNWTRSFGPHDTWTFEIKPKWGFLPDSHLIDQKHRYLKKRRCRFCMHQRLRNYQHRTSTTMEKRYCPLDLYSGDPQRMRQALMISLTQPHGYLKLFHNGHLMPHEQWSALLSALFDGMDGDDRSTSTSSKRDDWIGKVADLLVNILMEDPILAILKERQQTLDTFDIEGIYPLYEKYGQQPTHDIDHWKTIVQQYLKRQQSNSYTENLDIQDFDDDQEEIRRIYEYVLSMILKDCSVMICLTKDYESKKGDGVTTNSATAAPMTMKTKSDPLLTTSTSRLITSSTHSFRYHIKVVDLDLKKWDKIPYWFELDKQIIQHNLWREYQDQEHDWTCLE
ncbi:inositol-pentakisphosphate 2-kinase [Halteromyces radiatus]|uniref:inositol-pentakisphosphate 2-kinase n=1 Tax=Halteromyces radiatus TaxID=101107 RepID=UPI00221FA0F4|nr:inositol-pentakisphosphate 2-kinase [Halteromyces radiatus]KAI8081494.1 inositol-pentakisphosphate 2-kinase [Halteromyces radiatus]